jgi:hypothetical protein
MKYWIIGAILWLSVAIVVGIWFGRMAKYGMGDDE